VPWCDACARFWTQPSMNADGTCPSCGRSLGGERATARNIDVKKLAGEDTKIPWHFKVLVLAVAVYLGWRLVQLVVWIF
jgi:hypothetical protein